MDQSKGTVKSINISKRYLGLWSKNSMKTSPHPSTSKQSKLDNKSIPRFHERGLSMIKSQESVLADNRKPQHKATASVVHESFTSIKRHPRTFKGHLQNKENDSKADNVGIVLNVEDGTNKGVIFTANDSYINNLTINPVAYTSKPVEASKGLSTKSEDRLKRKPLKKCDSEYLEIASRLEVRLKKSVRDLDRTSSQDKFNIYRSFFNEIIQSDFYFGGMLKKIQGAYESVITELNDSLAKQSDYYETKLHQVVEEEAKKRQHSEQQNISILKELKRQALYIERLKGNIKELKMERVTDCIGESNSRLSKEHEEIRYSTLKKSNKTEGHRRDYSQVELKTLKKTKSTKFKECSSAKQKTEATPSKKKVTIPKLDLTKLRNTEEHTNKQTSLKETADEVIQDYNDEFMAMEDIFSQSWKDALAKEKRY